MFLVYQKKLKNIKQSVSNYVNNWIISENKCEQSITTLRQ